MVRVDVDASVDDEEEEVEEEENSRCRWRRREVNARARKPIAHEVLTSVMLKVISHRNLMIIHTETQDLTIHSCPTEQQPTVTSTGAAKEAAGERQLVM